MTIFEEKIKKNFPNAALFKSKSSAALLSFLELPTEVKDWLLKKFSDDNGNIDAYSKTLEHFQRFCLMKD